jgi:CheY-like chemotaxis protein
MLRLETVNLNQSLAETLELLRPALHAGIEVKLHTASNLWDVHADPSQISQVLLNLCLNARDAMPEHGELTLRTENVQFSEEQARGQVQVRPGEFVCLRVADTGCGIAPETMPRIFEPFFTTKGPGKGTGLGLAMVFGIVEQHRGWIQCHSTVSEGTRFEVYLPRHLPPLPPPASMEGPCKPLRGSETILIVEDEALIRTLARTILERLGYRILMAEDGLRAVEVYEQEDTRIDLVLLDLTMPRMSGVETLDRLVEIDPDVCVVFSSGFSADLPPVSHHRQVHGFIGKPYRPDQLCASIRAALDRRKVDRSLHDGLRAARERQTDPAFS